MSSQEHLKSNNYYIVSDKEACMICGLWFNELTIGWRPWQGEVRAIYPTWDHKVKLTRAGHRLKWKNFVLDTDTARWRNLKERPEFTCQINDFYMFHDRCWNRLMEHFCPGEFDPVSLHQALKYFPRPPVPWPFYLSEPRQTVGRRKYGVFALPTIEQLMQPTKATPEPADWVAEGLAATYRNKTDLFSRLPIEICEIIAVHLPTRDFLSLRRVSRAMALIFTSMHFWRSRFFINEERGYLHPLIQKWTSEKGNSTIDWRLLYHCTSTLKCPIDFYFPIRVWESLRWLRDATLAIHTRTNENKKRKKHYRGHSMPPQFAGRALQHYHNTRFQNMHVDSVDVGPTLRKIAISAVNDGYQGHITGMKFIFDDRPEVLIGYSAPGAKVVTDNGVRGSIFKYPGVQLVVNITRLRGFTIFHNAHSIRGITVIRDSAHPEGFDCIDRHGIDYCYSNIYLDEVTKVIVTYDHFKLTHLGILGVMTKRDNREGLMDKRYNYLTPVLHS
ncbi:hypothetical protein BGW36DRAFT_361664 [Talaromyces proteolyticus]|uniref:F-box domain-containing protein n=1 Tax=Talaromyces proteolyticus TaxID=1131652 RepID=A0AAD4KPJ8_9EURO|nr:uncharacterized protein BGW36DRAFT_361664 [Talaromyces proteolyticus]KAH8693828.1 hypothetical protein BGW36DRAFT_361664 [Talaromyces proteolyticus]